MVKQISFLKRAAIALLAAVLVLAAASPALAEVKTLKEGQTISLGKQGIAVSVVGPRAVLVDVAREKAPIPPQNGVTLRFPVLWVEFRNLDERVVSPEGISYVFFKLDKGERAMWEAEGSDAIAVYYKQDPPPADANGVAKWVKCPNTVLVDKDVYGRLACLASVNGWYGIGGPDYHYESYTPPSQ